MSWTKGDRASALGIIAPENDAVVGFNHGEKYGKKKDESVQICSVLVHMNKAFLGKSHSST